MLGANLPDIDVAVLLWGSTAGLAVRRGWTHGVLALAVLPLALTAAVWAWDRLVRAAEDRPGPPLRLGQVLLLAAASVLTHPTLDYLNVYGMRWLMPFVDRWFYGDILFIVDPWVWAALAAGIYLSARSGIRRPARWARLALVATVAYVAVMAMGTAVGRRAVATRVGPGARFMVAPVPVNPFRRAVVVDDADGYRLGSVVLLPRPVLRFDAEIGKGPWHEAVVRRAQATPDARAFLHWARFPLVTVGRSRDSTVVHFIDARYALDEEAPFGVLRVTVPASPPRR